MIIITIIKLNFKECNQIKLFSINLNVINWGLGIGDWGLGPIPNPQSPSPNIGNIIKFSVIS